MISIVTATYKRQEIIKSLAKSLADQTSKLFEWIIIVDSNEEEDIANYTNVFNYIIKEYPNIEVSIFFKKNGGKHSCVNYSIDLCAGEYLLVVDDDDSLTSNAISFLNKKIKEYENKGIVSYWFLQKSQKNKIVGESFKSDEFVDTYVNTMINVGVKGDKKSMYLLEHRRKFRYPEIPGENFVGESTLHLPINSGKKSVFMNEAIYISEYIPGGLTDLGVKNRLNNPYGGVHNSISYINDSKVSFKIKTKKTILLNSYCKSGNISLKYVIRHLDERKLRNIFWILITKPLGLLFYMKSK